MNKACTSCRPGSIPHSAPRNPAPSTRTSSQSGFRGPLLSLTLLLLTGAAGAVPTGDAAFLRRVQEDTEWLSGYGTRQIGTPEHARLQGDLLETLQAIPNVRVWTHEFPVLVPVHEEAYLEVSGDGGAERHAVLPLWPDVSRLNTTRSRGLFGRLIYVGQGEFADLPARSLRGNIAVMELSAYAEYRRAFDFGASAVIFLESDRPGEPLPTQQPLYKPRFYVPAGPLADALRAGEIPEGRLFSQAQWRTVTARNYYAGVFPEGTEGVAPYALVAPYDSMSLVMGVAPGADAALDCATLLNLLRDEAASPRRALLFGFIDAYHINQLGMRYMAAMLTVTPDGRVRKAYDELETADLDAYREAVEELDRYASTDAGLTGLHDRRANRQLRRMFKDTIGPELLRLQELQGELRLASLRADTENKPATNIAMLSSLDQTVNWLRTRHRAELSEDAIQKLAAADAFVEDCRAEGVGEGVWDRFDEARQMATLIQPLVTTPLRTRNRILETVYSRDLEVAPELLAIAHSLWARMEERVRGQYEEQQRRAAFFEPLDRIRAEIARAFGVEGDEDAAISPLVVGLDLSDCGVLVGAGGNCAFNRVPVTVREFERALRRAVQLGELWPEDSPLRRVVNIDAITGRVGAAQRSLGDRALIASAAQAFELPGVMWLTDDAPRPLVDTPLDRFERLDWGRIDPQLEATRQFFDWVFTTDETLSSPRQVSETSALWRHGMGRIVDISAGETVPRVPRSGFLVTLVGGRLDTDGIRAHEFTWSGADGAFRIPLLCAHMPHWVRGRNVSAVNLDDRGAIIESLSTTESLVTARLATTFNLGNRPGDQLPRAVTFACAELNGPSFFDARFLEPLRQALLQDTARGGAPRQAHFDVDETGQMWGLVAPEIRWQLILRAGAARVRMALLNAVPDGREQGLSLRETFQRGFSVGEQLPTLPAHVSARDILTLNGWRLADFRAAGIQSEKVDSIREATRKSLQAADEALERDDGAGLHRASVRALASEIRAYQAVRDMGLDIARGAIFLMLMLVPFCVTMERLIFACSRIGRQVVASLAIFAVMTLLLWAFHPAFRISSQPLVIVMAFTILAMSVVVISMVLRRFQSSVQQFRSTLAEGSGAKMGRGGLLGSAVFLGIANMRKRKVRTLLTGSTIVLVTFALLCFSSASSYVDRRDFRLSGLEAERPTVLVRRPSMGPLSWSAVPILRNLLAEEDVDVGERVWLVGGQGETTWRMQLLNPETGIQAPLRGALGLPPIEPQLTGVDRVLEDWASFAEEGGCYISSDTAAHLDVGPGDRVVLRGLDLVVRGVFDPLRLEDELTMLDGQRITPYDYTQQERDWIDRDSQDAIEQETGSAAAMQPEGDDDSRYVPSRDVIVLPEEVVRALGGDLRSFGIACGSSEQAKRVAELLTEVIVYPAYYANLAGGVNVVVASPLIAVPPKSLVIPLTIAALIIFTTMLNSVSERKSEIYVYSSLGLAPTHVGMLFVAEALTYGLMGAVFGYVAGQGTAALLTEMGWMQGVTLNYSGTAVINTMLMVQAVVVLSAIVPAITAGKIAAPSSEMSWRVPQPVDGVIRDVLPFTVSPSAAAGLVAFIHEYLEAHRDGVLGGFDVDRIVVLQPGEDGAIAGIEAQLWLAPFDMGVRQTMRLTVQPPDDGACAIHAEIRHGAGTPKMWWRLNRPFFGDLRRQLLGWRKLSADRIRAYVGESNDRTPGSPSAGPTPEHGPLTTASET